MPLRYIRIKHIYTTKHNWDIKVTIAGTTLGTQLYITSVTQGLRLVLTKLSCKLVFELVNVCMYIYVLY